MYLADAVSALLGGTQWKGTGRTSIFLKFRIRGLKEDLDTVKGSNYRLCLGRWAYMLCVSGTCGTADKQCVHTTHPATPPAMPERITWSAVLIFDASELIRV